MISDTEDSVEPNGRLIYQKPACDNMLNAEVALQLDENVITGRVEQQLLVP